MLNDLNEDQRKLAQLMSEISERCYRAGWMEGLEFALWDVVNGGNRKYGQHEISQVEIDELRSLSEKCDCWIMFDDNLEEIPIKIAEWEMIFSGTK
jgi:hypothetical protein